MLLDEVTPHRHRHVVSVLAIPRHLLHGESFGAVDENRSAEEELQRYRPVAQGVQILGRRDFEVVCALQGKADLRGAAEAGNHDGTVLPQKGVLRAGPAFARPEQVDQAVGLGVGVWPPQRIDAYLATQCDGVDGFVTDRGCTDPGGENRSHRVRFGCHAEDGERHLSHWATTLLRSSIASKNSAINARTSWPPSNPRHSIRNRPTNS